MRRQTEDKEYTKNLDIFLEGLDDVEQDDMDEGVLGNLAGKAAKVVAGGVKDVVAGLAKGTIDGVLGPKDVRLMKTAVKAFTEILANNDIATTEDKVSNAFAKILARSILKKRETEGGSKKQPSSPKKSDFSVVK